MEPKTGKRIVSIRDYINTLRDKYFLYVWGLLITLLGTACAAALLYMLIAVWGNFSMADLFPFTFLAALFAGGAAAFLFFGTKSLKEAKQIDPGVPLTRANTADLPAPDSLVRASTEPEQEQQSVLLRAAHEGQESRAEELVRAVQGQE